MWRDGKYSDITEFLTLVPAVTGQPERSTGPTYTNVTTPDPGKPNRKKKGKSIAIDTKVTRFSSTVALEKGTAPLPAANQRFFAPGLSLQIRMLSALLLLALTWRPQFLERPTALPPSALVRWLTPTDQ